MAMNTMIPSAEQLRKLSLYIDLLGLAFILFGGIMLFRTLVNPNRFVHTEGRLIRFGHPSATDMLEPIVEFELDGETVQSRCEYISLERCPYRVGDTVKISYDLRKTLGIETLKVYLDENGTASRRDNRFNGFVGAVFLIAGIAMLIVGLRMGMA